MKDIFKHLRKEKYSKSRWRGGLNFRQRDGARSSLLEFEDSQGHFHRLPQSRFQISTTSEINRAKRVHYERFLIADLIAQLILLLTRAFQSYFNDLNVTQLISTKEKSSLIFEQQT